MLTRDVFVLLVKSVCCYLSPISLVSTTLLLLDCCLRNGEI